MHIRRAMLFMPGDSRRKIEKGADMDVDAIIMDLEDGVALNNKIEARQSVADALKEVDFGAVNGLCGRTWSFLIGYTPMIFM